jgi:hypothetical protein
MALGAVQAHAGHRLIAARFEGDGATDRPSGWLGRGGTAASSPWPTGEPPYFGV